MAVLPALTMISIFTLTVSAYTVSVYQLGLDGREFLDYFAQTTILSDFFFCGVKAFFFAIIICFVSCFYGFHCRPGPDGVGGATNSAVVVSAVVCAVLNYLLSEILFAGRGL